jgi:hypothetical protein
MTKAKFGFFISAQPNNYRVFPTPRKPSEPLSDAPSPQVNR